MNRRRLFLGLLIMSSLPGVAFGLTHTLQTYPHLVPILFAETVQTNRPTRHSPDRSFNLRINFRQIQSDSAANPDAWNRLGVSHFKAGRYEDALAAYGQAIALKADHPEAWNNKGAALSRLDRDAEALSAYERALKLKPDFPRAWNNKGRALAKMGRFQESLLAYNEATRRDPSDPEGWKNKAAVLASMGRYEEALDAVEEAHRLDPDNSEILEMKEKIKERVMKKAFTL